MPLTASIHFSDYNHLAVSTMILAATGQFQPGNLSNLANGGEWTVLPNFARTICVVNAAWSLTISRALISRTRTRQQSTQAPCLIGTAW